MSNAESMYSMPCELWWLIFKLMSPVDLASFSRCSTMFRELGTCFKEEMYTVQRALGKFLLDVEMGDYQDLQADTGLLVAGSGVLGFFNHDDDLRDYDTFCELSQCGTVGNWYIDRGFEFQPSAVQMSVFANEFTHTLDVQRSQNRVVAIAIDEDVRDCVYDNVVAEWTFKRGCGIVRLLATDGIPLKGLLSVHSTCCMNVLSHRAAYCCFPKLTLEQQATVLIDLCAPFTEPQMKTVKMHQMQGFSVQFKPSGRVVCNAKSALTFLYSRYLGDKHCYKIPLKYLGKRTPMDDYIEANTWSLAYTRKLNTCDYYPIDVPGTRTEYIASTSFASKLETQLIVLRGQIQSGLIT
ncbi:uncharacterized protein C8R40DRAFT_515470 [Lentinula edodes]|uniref:uncharacterized protein n=1 Tax=Lentinula edodes TaxID=5353 RepID=UPI001E8D82D0|nr:uncharacterized protein C8R40DRAFT_515470 [Lentinula edodes]KAH7871977.1 hypothetical protein C8R40DRAFT_515470 [Lentinula edodes]